VDHVALGARGRPGAGRGPRLARLLPGARSPGRGRSLRALSLRVPAARREGMPLPARFRPRVPSALRSRRWHPARAVVAAPVARRPPVDGAPAGRVDHRLHRPRRPSPLRNERAHPRRELARAAATRRRGPRPLRGCPRRRAAGGGGAEPGAARRARAPARGRGRSPRPRGGASAPRTSAGQTGRPLPRLRQAVHGTASALRAGSCSPRTSTRGRWSRPRSAGCPSSSSRGAAVSSSRRATRAPSPPP
jgi:hypothetical protein